ncbi:NUDIX hydrolase [Jeotgalibacillus campisalis]|uniref:Nudix hydrolase domain-containing protein n=1 Tax=Jeotgalibacillus campisalis TaxID=220754 RepID=A0A0C2SAP6_9BACL|nr:NUDIX hydrolase [Jeotgalibacillus campisalis]KIL50994.1 hypothetical protein KR50_08750 [Jeotgalibacillus campisalis]
MTVNTAYFGAAGVCVNDEGKLLMVLQGTKEEHKKWSVPSGGKENGETFEECCIREFKEETGFDAKIIKRLFVKKEELEGIGRIEVHYFLVRIIGGTKTIQDPDELIYEIDWKDYEQLQTLDLSFPEDRSVLCEYINLYTTTRKKAVIHE